MALPSSSVGAVAPTTPIIPGIRRGGGHTHRQGLRDGASRPALLGDGGGFYQLPLLPGEHCSRGAEPLPSAPLTAPVTFAGRSVGRARVTPLVSSIGFFARPETGKANAHPGARPGPGAPWLPCGVTGGGGTPGSLRGCQCCSPGLTEGWGGEPHSVGVMLSPVGLPPSGVRLV